MATTLAEAEGVEPVEPHPDDPDDPEAEPTEGGEPSAPLDESGEPEAQTAAMSERELEANLEKLTKEATRHANRISEIMGADAQQLEPCPRCLPQMPGFIFPPELAPVGDEQKAAVLASVGEGTATGILPSETTRRCERCDGRGRWESGSRIDNLRYIDCDYCKGKGYVVIGGPAQHSVAVATAPAEPYEPVVSGEEASGRDLWGRPPEHPDYGKHPLYASQPQP